MNDWTNHDIRLISDIPIRNYYLSFVIHKKWILILENIQKLFANTFEALYDFTHDNYYIIMIEIAWNEPTNQVLYFIEQVLSSILSFRFACNCCF